MALLTIEWRIGQQLIGVNGINWGRVMDHYVKDLRAYKLKFIFTACFGPHTSVVG